MLQNYKDALTVDDLCKKFRIELNADLYFYMGYGIIELKITRIFYGGVSYGNKKIRLRFFCM